MSEKQCSVSNCKKASSIYCYQCEENYCQEHYLNHQDKLKSRFNLLLDEKKFLDDKFRLLNVKQVKEDFRRDLEQWRTQSHQLIENLYREKVDEATRYIKENLDRPEMALRGIDEEVKKIIGNPPLTHEQIQTIQQGNDYVKKKLQLIEEKKINVEMPPDPFRSASGMFPPGSKSINEFVLPEKSRVYSCSNEGGIGLCGNDKSLLICDNQSLLLLDENFLPQEEFTWTHGSIYHLSWIELLKKFLLINDRRELYLIHERTLSNFERISSIPLMNWWSATTYDKYLYLSTFGQDPILVQADLTKSFQLIKQMKSPFLTDRDEFIQQINSWNEKLIVIVSNRLEHLSICQLRSPLSFNLLSSIPLNFSKTSYQNSIRSTILFPPLRRLLIIEENSPEIIVLSADGSTSMIDYRRPIRNLCTFRRNIFVIRTDRNLVFYQL